MSSLSRPETSTAVEGGAVGTGAHTRVRRVWSSGAGGSGQGSGQAFWQARAGDAYPRVLTGSGSPGPGVPTQGSLAGLDHRGSDRTGTCTSTWRLGRVYSWGLQPWEALSGTGLRAGAGDCVGPGEWEELGWVLVEAGTFEDAMVRPSLG